MPQGQVSIVQAFALSRLRVVAVVYEQLPVKYHLVVDGRGSYS